MLCGSKIYEYDMRTISVIKDIKRVVPTSGGQKLHTFSQGQFQFTCIVQ